MFWTCFSTYLLYYYSKGTLIHIENFERVITEIHFAYETHCSRVFVANFTIALVSLLQPDNGLPGLIKHRREHD